MYTNIEILYALCNRYNLFTCGTNGQYNKMFELARAGMPVDIIARVIWLCSDDHMTYNEIEQAILDSGYEAGEIAK